MKILKWLLALLLLGTLILVIIGFAMHDPKPEHTPSSEADQLADKVLTALNKPAWDTVKALKWEFPGGHRYLWDKQSNICHISWGDHSVLMNLDDQSGPVTIDGKEATGTAAESARKTAWSYWCNDSFWMFAPYKIKDLNTERSIVRHEGKDALMVSYKGGGVTPGDSYLWLLDDNHIPTAYKMWVSIIPIGGLEFSWDDWQTMPSGAKLATTHKSKLFTLRMEGVEEASSIDVWIK